MGGIYGELLITAYIMFVAILTGFNVMCVLCGRKKENQCQKKTGYTEG